jgi:two-component system phosphate regulon sensor histidine kinase PhoR
MKRAVRLFRENPAVQLYLPLMLSALVTAAILGWVSTRSISDIVVLCVVACVLVLPACVVVSRRIGHPLRRIRQGIEEFSRGNLGFRIRASGLSEFRSIARSMNQMARELEERVSLVETQRAEQEAVLSSMSEGVIAVSREGAVIRLNSAAAQLLGVDARWAERRSIEEVIRNRELQEFIRAALARRTPHEEEVVVYETEERVLLCKSTDLAQQGGTLLGTLIVLDDVTRIRKLERVRRDFVANVSHELKTPITSIKASAETLLAGAIERPDEGRRFVDIIGRHAERLNTIVDDLLSLARLEEEQEQRTTIMEDSDVNTVVRAALQLCEVKAVKRQLELVFHPAAGLTAPMNHFLIEQAVVNLVDNAIKYSPANSRVEVRAARVNGFVRISVTDYGIGIDKMHHARLFERFYRVDQARSRKEGGTGLGLAIVKHIAQLHGGYPSVESTPGKGSTFSFFIKGHDDRSVESASA